MYSDSFKVLETFTIMSQNFVSFAIWIAMVVAVWKIFEKAGEEGWKSLIPIYNNYILCKIAKCKKLFFVDLAMDIVIIATLIPMFITGFLALALVGSDASAFNMDTLGIGFVVALIIFSIAALVECVVSILIHINLAKVFGKGGAFAVGLILLPIVFYLILGFSNKITYTGNNENITQL